MVSRRPCRLNKRSVALPVDDAGRSLVRGKHEHVGDCELKARFRVSATAASIIAERLWLTVDVHRAGGDPEDLPANQTARISIDVKSKVCLVGLCLLGDVVPDEGDDVLVGRVGGRLVAAEAHDRELGLDHARAHLRDADRSVDKLAHHRAREGRHRVPARAGRQDEGRGEVADGQPLQPVHATHATSTEKGTHLVAV